MSSLDDLLDRIRQRVEDRAAGSAGVPATTPDSGDSAGNGDSAGEMAAALARMAEAGRFDARRIPTSSRSRAGTTLHKLVARAAARQASGILQQVQTFADATRGAVELLAGRVEAYGFHTHPLLAAQVDAALDRLADAEPYGPSALRELITRVDSLEAALSPTGAPLRPWWAPDRWVDETQGTRTEVVARRALLVGELRAPVLDVACGRGELLEALRDAAIDATGAEADPRLLIRATSSGLRAVRQSPLVALGRAAEGAYGSIAALGVVERLGTQGSADLVGLAADKLTPGGRLLIESADPDGGRVWADPETRRPQEPAWLTWMCREAGFTEVRVTRSAQSPAGANPGAYVVVASLPGGETTPGLD